MNQEQNCQNGSLTELSNFRFGTIRHLLIFSLLRSQDTMTRLDSPLGLQEALIVEDDPVFHQAIAAAINDLGSNWSILSCRTGAEALARCRPESRRLALALVDLGLPDMAGETVIQELRSRYPELPILVISVFSDEQQVLNAIRAGAVGYLLKGDEGFDMTTAMQQVLEGTYPISPILARYLFQLAGREEAAAMPDAPKIAPRELELLEHIAQGRRYVEAAAEMGVTLSTVQTHARALFRKLDCHSRTQALVKARKYRLLD
jgi:DNA-binding NarL/FixJ family response regulator